MVTLPNWQIPPPEILLSLLYIVLIAIAFMALVWIAFLALEKALVSIEKGWEMLGRLAKASFKYVCLIGIIVVVFIAAAFTFGYAQTFPSSFSSFWDQGIHWPKTNDDSNTNGWTTLFSFGSQVETKPIPIPQIPIIKPTEPSFFFIDGIVDALKQSLYILMKPFQRDENNKILPSVADG